MGKRHTTTSKPAIAYEFKEANKIPHTPKKTTTCNKPQSLIPPLPLSLEAPQSPLKKTAVTNKMTNGESEFAVIPYKKADTTSLRQTNHTHPHPPTSIYIHPDECGRTHIHQ